VTDTLSERDTEVSTGLAAAAFGSLADENRIAILLALWEAGPLSFADLQERAGFADSGHFNYHLDQLHGQFVGKAEDGYRLRAAGKKAIDVVFDERFANSAPAVEANVEADCPNCGAGLQIIYEGGQVRITCTACSTVVHLGYFPPGGCVSRDLPAFLSAYSARVWRDFTLAHRGVCPHCSGRMDTEVRIDPDWHLSLPVVSTCRGCGVEVGTTIGLKLLADPAVVAFLHDHGMHVDERPFWELEFCIDDADARIVGEDPLRVVFPIACDDEVLRVTVDDEARVVETERARVRQ